MKKYAFFLSLLLTGLFLLAGCGTICPVEPKPTIVPLHVDLQSSFDNDLVRVEIDGKVEYEERVSTNHVLGFADGFMVDKPLGEHWIRVTVNDAAYEERTFTLEKELYIGVGYGFDYEQPNRISLLFQEERFLYD